MLVVPVLVALVIGALTPLGDGVRELIFPTKATLTGNVTLTGRPLADASVTLNGEDAGRTDSQGKYVITGVDNGVHVVAAQATGADPGQVTLTVARNADGVDVQALDLRPIASLGYTIGSLELRPKGSSFQLRYDFTLWIQGDAAVLDRLKSVAYALPAPFTAASGRITSRATSFCYRQSGRLDFDTVLGSPGFGEASATVSLNDGKSFRVSGAAGNQPPPACTATEVGREELKDGTSPTGPQPGPSDPPGPRPTTPHPSRTTPAPTTDPPPDPRILSFIAATGPNCNSGSSGEVKLAVQVADADRFTITPDFRGALEPNDVGDQDSTTLIVPFRCDGQAHSYQVTASRDDRTSQPRTVTVDAATPP